MGGRGTSGGQQGPGGGGRFGKDGTTALAGNVDAQAKATRSQVEGAVREFLGKAVLSGNLAGRNESAPNFSESFIKEAAQEAWRAARSEANEKGGVLSPREMGYITNRILDREMNKYDKYVRTQQDKIRTAYFKSYSPKTDADKKLAEKIVRLAAIQASKQTYSSSSFAQGNVKYDVREAISAARQALEKAQS